MTPISDYTEDVPRTPEAARATLEQLLQDPRAEDPNERAVAALGSLIDISSELARQDGTDEAIRRGNAILAGALTGELRALTHYFLASAWEDARRQRRSEKQLAEWEQPEMATQVVHLRRAARLMEALDTAGEEWSARRCQVHTNLGNAMSHVGRLVDAIAHWDRALWLEPQFAMAIANRAYEMLYYGQLVHDPGHQVLFLRAADAGLTEALHPALASQMHRQARASFTRLQAELRAQVPRSVLSRPTPHEHSFPKRMSRRERAYREWCLTNRLFLNDLNDLSQNDPIVARDVLTLPGLTKSIAAPLPHAYGFFNQLKQEFTSSRLFCFEGIHADRVHFADRNVTLIDTLDYPAYGHGAEQVKTAYRIAYSLFDKIAYFLNDYLSLGIAENRVSFRSVWYLQQKAERGLRPELCRPDNTPLKGLFWLAKDFYEDEPGFRDAVEPDAQDLAQLRNHLEHRYVKLHLFGTPSEDSLRRDSLAYALDRTEFERRTLRILQLARSALIYLSLGVHREESRRRAEHPDARVAETLLFAFQDRFKL